MFEAGIDIITKYPDLGQCTIHWQDINHICLQKQCHHDKYYCNQCIPLHEGHKTQTNSQLIRQLAERFRKNIPNNQVSKDRIIYLMNNVKNKYQEYLIQMANTFKILKEVNIQQVIIIIELLKCRPQNLQQLIIQLGIKRNPNYFQSLANRWDKLKFDSPLAEKYYEQKVNNIKQNIDKLTKMTEIIMNNFLELNPVFSIDQKQIIQLQKQEKNKQQFKKKNETKKQEQKIQQQMNQKQKKEQQERIQKQKQQKQKLQKQRIKLEEAQGQFVDICYRQQDLVTDQIIERLQKQKDKASKIRSLDLQGNSVYTDGLQKLLKSRVELFPNLRRLNLKNCYLEDISLKILLASDIPHLTYLNLAQNFMDINDEIVNRIKAKWPDIDLETS